MMEEWREYKVSDICTGIYEGPHATPPISQRGGIYLGIPDISNDGHIDYKNAKRISEKDLPQWTKRVTPQEDDIVFTNEATLNLYAIIPKGFHGCLGRRLGLIRPDKSVVSVKYLFYYFFSPEWRNTIAQNKVSGATVERILMTKFPSFRVKLPSMSIQNKIASILSSLDDKIEVNKRMNENLEQQAQALYKSWFVDFEPFKDGEFVESELGMIPKGWRVVSFKDVCLNITDGVHNTVKDDLNGNYYLLSCKNIKGGILSIGENERRIDKATFEKLRKRTKLQRGDILLSSVGTIGEILLLSCDPVNYEFQRSVAILKPNPELISSPFLFYSMKNLRDTIVYAAHGAVQQCLFISDIANLKTIYPNHTEISRFTDVASIIENKIAMNQEESRRLAQLRDTLLPRLMSGELKVKD